VVVMTALDRARLPGQWRRRIQMTLELPLPCHPLDEFRAAVFRAVFRGHGLEALARDGDLMRRLAVATDPRLRRTALPAPYARRADALSRWRVELNTAADIHGWVCQTIDLAGSTPFDAGDFWLAAVSET
jgi:hypothetical protein